MQKLISILIVLIPLLVFNQENSLKGVIIDDESNDPLSFASIQLISDQSDTIVTNSDINGNFNIEKLSHKNYRLSITYVGYDSFDTIITSFDYLTIKMNNSYLLDRFYLTIDQEKANKDIDLGNLYFYTLGGFICVTNSKKDNIFEKKYNIKYVSQGCIVQENDNPEEYNITVAKYLINKFGKDWKKGLRKDVYGFKEIKKLK